MRQRSIFSIALLGAVVFAVGCAKKQDDATLVTNIKAEMFSDSLLKDASLQVTSNNGQVTLSWHRSERSGPLRRFQDRQPNSGGHKSKRPDSVEEAKVQTAGTHTDSGSFGRT